MNAGPSSAALSSFSNPQKRVKRSPSATGSSSAIPRGTPSSASTSTKYDSVPEDKKWKLECSGKSINDTMRAAAASAVYEHPVHSMLLDPMDPIWKEKFTKEELTEIKLYRSREFSGLPFASGLNYHPVNQFDEQWVKESMLGCSKLFLEKDVMSLKDPSEAGLLKKVWSFTYKLYEQGVIDAKLDEKCSASSAKRIGRNNSRSLSLKEKRQRKAMGAKVDTLFKYGQVEIGCSEVGKNDVSVVDDKYLDDGLVKLLKILRDMLCLQVRKNPGQIHHLRTFGLLMMGMELQVLMLDVPVGSSIVRVTRSTAFSFPNSLADIPSDLPSLLEITYKVKQALLENIEILNNKKQKAAVERRSLIQDLCAHIWAGVFESLFPDNSRVRRKPSWFVNGIDVSVLPREYRNGALKGAQMRKAMCNG